MTHYPRYTQDIERGLVGYWPLNDLRRTITDGIFAHFKMDDNAASTTVVDSKFGSDGTANANTSTLTTTGLIGSGSALNFSGSTQITLQNNVEELGNNFSISFWMNIDTSDTNFRTVINGAWQASGAFTSFYYNGNFSFQARDQSYNLISVNKSLSTGTLYHVVITADGTDLKLYVNGVLEASDDMTGSDICYLASAITVGGTTNDFDGQMDDLRFYNRALSLYEVMHLNNQGTGQESTELFRPRLDGIVAHYKMNGDATEEAYGNDATLPTPTVIIDCESTTGWTDNNASTNHSLNTTTFLYGSGAINLETDGEADGSQDISAYYEFSPAIDITGQVISTSIYIKDQATLDKLKSGNVGIIYLWDTSNNFARYLFYKDELTVGWNVVTADVDNPASTSGTPNFANFDKWQILFENTGTARTISAGDIIIDQIQYGTTQKATGKRNQALFFDGVESLDCGNGQMVQDFSEGFTYAGWVRFSNLDYTGGTGTLNSFVCKGNTDQAPAHAGFWIAYDNRTNETRWTYTCFGNTNGGFSGGSNNFTDSEYDYTFENGVWYHIGVTIDENSVARLYINGEQHGSDKQFSNLDLNNTTQNLYIGAGYNGVTRQHYGYLDDQRIYNRGLSASEMSQLYSYGNGTEDTDVLRTEEGTIVARDLIGFNDLTIYGVTNTSTGISGLAPNAMLFDGVDDYLESTNEYASLDDQSIFAISMWIYLDSTTPYQQILQNGIDGTERWGVGININQKLAFGYYNGTSYIHSSSGASAPPTGKWLHVVVNHNSSGSEMYVNGVLQTGTEAPYTGSTLSFRVGNKSGDSFLSGKAQKLRLYNRNLLGGEANKLYRLKK